MVEFIKEENTITYFSECKEIRYKKRMGEFW